MVKRVSYMNRLIHSMWNGEIKVITGIRRCGKSVLLFDLFFEYLLSQNVSEDHILKIELDQRRYYKFRNPITLCEYVESIVRDKKGEKFYQQKSDEKHAYILRDMRKDYNLFNSQLGILGTEKETFTKYLLKEKTISDIAEDQGITYESARQQMQKIKVRMKKQVKRFMDGQPGGIA